LYFNRERIYAQIIPLDSYDILGLSM
jgi:hypothetical protein